MDEIGPDFPFKATPKAVPATLKIDHDCGVKITTVSTMSVMSPAINNPPLPADGPGNETFSNGLLISLLILVPTCTVWKLGGRFKTTVFFAVITTLPILITFCAITSATAPCTNERVKCPGLPVEHYLTFHKEEDQVKYRGRNKVPMETFMRKYFDGDADFNGDVLEVLEYRHDWASFRFTWELFRYIIVNFVTDVTAKYGLRWFKIWKYFLASATTSSRQGSATCYQITLVKNINSVRRIDGVSTQFALSTALEASKKAGRAVFPANNPSRLQPVFNRERISDLECVERHVQNLLPLLDTEGQTAEIKDLFLRFTLDVSADFTLGVDLDTLKRPLNRFAESFERLRHWKIQKERSNPFKFLVLRSRYQADLDYIESFMDPIIMETVNEIKAEEAGETPHKKDSGFNLLGASAEVSTNRRFLRDELLTALFAGRDNTAMAFTWILYELAQHPDVVRDMRREIDAQIGLNNINPEAYSTVPEGFPPADEWCPKRWNNWFPKPWAFVPFHGGPRFCLGQQLVLVEMSYTLVQLFQRFSRFELRIDEVGTAKRQANPWLRRTGEPELVERYMQNQPRMVTEIALFPRREVRVAFVR
ncbi:unnamed protein product [Fusarium graminearum]|uniref:sphingolipid C(9)-methyltransferase n=1 Tax=Gibberella zeae (strain ATCC MYA-4620 / CBS 123657 / FGSC 9075 / NRRL 31084 / PH-1) TaxID=229533 RepID=A0A098DBB7_GIBZE|nr:unnamed protein product [Fusarium graminearum]CZS79535.1 unnamed protein product [Fusarium graminearum]